MTTKTLEAVAVALTLLGSVAILSAPFIYEGSQPGRVATSDERVVTLTGVAAAGTWTDQRIDAATYWLRDAPAARPVLWVGESTLLRLQSSDVIHTFYAPELGVGPVEVHPGQVVDVWLKPERAGVFPYFCTTPCGQTHFLMRGMIEVRDGSGRPESPILPEVGRHWLIPPPDAKEGRAARGGWLFHQKGCATCHGVQGRSGVENFNSVDGTVPALDTLAGRMFPSDLPSARRAVDQLEVNTPIEEIEGFAVNRSLPEQLVHDEVKRVIQEGAEPEKKDVDGLRPPLEMPAWGRVLTNEEINTVIAYLLTLDPGVQVSAGSTAPASPSASE